MIAQSQTDRGKAVSQINALKSSSIAESGVNQYLDFLNNNRVLLTYPSCVGTLDSSGVCPDTGTTKSWSNASSAGILPTTSPSPSPGGTCPQSQTISSNANQTCSTQITTVWSNAGDTGWRDLGGGQFKLVSYSYTPTGAPNTAPGNG
jgi:hypothetical protein